MQIPLYLFLSRLSQGSVYTHIVVFLPSYEDVDVAINDKIR